MHKIKIAIADDHNLFRTGMTSILGDSEDLEVVLEASNGKELIKSIRKNRPDIILMDLRMPVMNGLEATRIIKSKYPEIKIIVLTMFDDESSIVNLLESGVNGYLLKSSEMNEVFEAINAVIEKDFYFNDFVSGTILKRLTNKRKKTKHYLNSIVTLTRREREILRLICREFTNSEIARELSLSPRTIDGYRNRLLEKFGAKNTVGMVVYAVRNNLVDLHGQQ